MVWVRATPAPTPHCGERINRLPVAALVDRRRRFAAMTDAWLHAACIYRPLVGAGITAMAPTAALPGVHHHTAPANAAHPGRNPPTRSHRTGSLHPLATHGPNAARETAAKSSGLFAHGGQFDLMGLAWRAYRALVSPLAVAAIFFTRVQAQQPVIKHAPRDGRCTGRTKARVFNDQSHSNTWIVGGANAAKASGRACASSALALYFDVLPPG